ncbi:MAG: hypothetical protein EOP05_22270 [Proteobacteria bacterium]|nr:MAG: hypothetical protein EOP05_22270 [Pseudomonadota bacterium]
MKTVALNNRTAVRSFFVLAALAGLYFYRRQGGTVSALAARGTDALGTARQWINKVAPSVDDSIAAASSTALPKARKSVSASAQI